jgi:hypothetical protein
MQIGARFERQRRTGHELHAATFHWLPWAVLQAAVMLKLLGAEQSLEAVH